MVACLFCRSYKKLTVPSVTSRIDPNGLEGKRNIANNMVWLLITFYMEKKIHDAHEREKFMGITGYV